MATVTTPRRPLPPSRPVDGAADGLSLRIPPAAFTLAGFRAWVKSAAFPDHVRVAFLGGEIHLDMSKEELETHNKVKMEVYRVLLALNVEADRGEFYGDGALLTNEAAGVSNNPDGVFVTWKSLDAGKARLVPREGERGQYLEIEGTPDWVMEVVSNSSVEKDTRQLRDAYHRAGVREYWLIDARGPEVVFQVLRRRKKGYAAAPSREGWQRSEVFGRGFRLERTKGRRGLWQYRLRVQDA